MRAYSQDLRERVLQAYDAGDGGYVTLSRRFRVAESTVYRWVRECRREGKRAPKVYRHGFVSVLDEDDGAVLRQLVEEQPDATLAEYATRFEARNGLGREPAQRLSGAETVGAEAQKEKCAGE